MGDFEKVTDFENLYKAYKKAKSGKGFKNSSARFEILALDGIHKLRQQLLDGSYKVAKYHEFMVYEPKERLIKAGSFKDKVVQHVLCDNVLLPRLKSEFIDHNYAGQIGKGTLYGLDCLSEDMLGYYSKHGTDGWILKCDISKFFYSIEHEKLKEVVNKYFRDEKIMWLNHMIIDSTDSPGLPLGNQSSQVFALLFLNEMDHMITEKLGIKFYGRYMDDFYLIHKDKEYLKGCLDNVRKYLASIGLSLNGKTQIIPFKNGIDFTGFHTYVTKDGKVIRKLRNEKKRANQKKYRRMAELVVAGKLSRDKFDESYTACKAHMAHGNTKKLIHSLDVEIGEILNGFGTQGN